MFEHGQFYWNELMSTNVEQAKAFYARTLGWSYESMPMPEGEYHIIKQGENMVGGMMQMPAQMPAGTPSHWFSYVSVDDVDARIAQVVAAGGQVVSAPFDVEGFGRFGIVQDPTGATVGWMTPVPMENEQA